MPDAVSSSSTVGRARRISNRYACFPRVARVFADVSLALSEENAGICLETVCACAGGAKLVSCQYTCGFSDMKVDKRRAERAELIQSVAALLIPLSLFISCCILAAGVFLVYNHEPAGWGFIAVTAVVSTVAFTFLIRFQNKFRASGILAEEMADSDVVDFEEEPRRKPVPTFDFKQEPVAEGKGPGDAKARKLGAESRV